MQPYQQPEQSSLQGLPTETQSPPPAALSGVMTAAQVGARQFKRLIFTPDYQRIFGQPALGFRAMIYGVPGGGKSSFLLMFSNYFARNFGPVFFVSAEEFGGSTLTEKVNRLKLNLTPNLYFGGWLDPNYLKIAKLLVIDSVNSLGLSIAEFRELHNQYPDLCKILVMQTTKAGDFRGERGWEHDIDIAMHLEKMLITAYKNRFGPEGSMPLKFPKVD